MAQRTLSLPQKSGLLSEPMLYETISRLVAGVNTALTLQSLPAAQVTAAGTIAVSDPVVRVTGPGSIRQILPVDFGVPIYLIALHGDVSLLTGGNIAAAVTILKDTGCLLVYDAVVQKWWPFMGAAPASGEQQIPKQSIAISAANSTIQYDPSIYRGASVYATGAGYSISYMTRSSGTYPTEVVAWVENVDPTVSFVINDNPALNGFRFPNATNLTMGPRRMAQFHYSAGCWWHITTV